MHRSRIAIIIILSFFSLIALLLLNTVLLLYDNGFVRKELSENPYDDHLDDNYNLKEIDMDIRNYLQNEKKSMENTLLNDKEKEHLKDVKDLFAAAKISLAIIIASIVLLLYYMHILHGNYFKETLLSVSRLIFSMALILIAAAFLLSGSFDTIFLYFHEALFTNDLWMMSSADSLADIYPKYFFMHSMQAILLRTAMIALLICFAGMYVQHAQSRKYRIKKSRIHRQNRKAD